MIGQKIIYGSSPIPPKPPDSQVITPQAPMLDASGYTRLISRIPGTYKVMGLPSRTIYTFTDAERVQTILNDDVPDLLNKKRHFRPCCNATGENLSLFEIYQE